MDFAFPDVGEGLSEGVLAKWLVKTGDSVKKDQIVAKVSTDKSVVDIPSSVEGTITEILAKEGDTITVGQVIMKTDGSSGSSEDAGSAAGDEAQPPSESSPSENAPAAAEEPVEAPTPTEASQENAEAVTPQQASAEATPAAATEAEEEPEEEHPDSSHVSETKRMAANVPQRERIEAPAKPDVAPHTNAQRSSSSDVLALPKARHYAREHHIDLAQITGSGPDGRITIEDLSGHADEHHEKHGERERATSSVHCDVLATPSVRRYARELQVDICEVRGTGEHERITREDVERAAKQGTSEPVPAGTQNAPTTSQPQAASQTPTAKGSSAGSTEALSPIRKIIAERMMASQQHTAAVTHTDRADVTKLVEVRESWKAHATEHDVKLTYLPFFIKATVAALKAYPRFNSSLEGEQLTIHDTYHIGIAVDTPHGLFVPVIRDADRKSIIELAREIAELAGAARDGKLTPAQMQGATFTISSVGNLGGEVFTPIINEPNAAILGIGAIRKRPHVVDGELAVRDVLVFSLTYDHRIVDGADGARFLSKIVELTEDPAHLLLEMS